jgi:hypothetical protein
VWPVIFGSGPVQKQILVLVPVKKYFGPGPGQKKKFGLGPNPVGIGIPKKPQ